MPWPPHIPSNFETWWSNPNRGENILRRPSWRQTGSPSASSSPPASSIIPASSPIAYPSPPSRSTSPAEHEVPVEVGRSSRAPKPPGSTIRGSSVLHHKAKLDPESRVSNENSPLVAESSVIPIGKGLQRKVSVSKEEQPSTAGPDGVHVNEQLQCKVSGAKEDHPSSFESDIGLEVKKLSRQNASISKENRSPAAQLALSPAHSRASTPDSPRKKKRERGLSTKKPDGIGFSWMSLPVGDPTAAQRVLKANRAETNPAVNTSREVGDGQILLTPDTAVCGRIVFLLSFKEHSVVWECNIRRNAEWHPAVILYLGSEKHGGDKFVQVLPITSWNGEEKNEKWNRGKGIQLRGQYYLIGSEDPGNGAIGDAEADTDKPLELADKKRLRKRSYVSIREDAYIIEMDGAALFTDESKKDPDFFLTEQSYYRLKTAYELAQEDRRCLEKGKKDYVWVYGHPPPA